MQTIRQRARDIIIYLLVPSWFVFKNVQVYLVRKHIRQLWIKLHCSELCRLFLCRYWSLTLFYWGVFTFSFSDLVSIVSFLISEICNLIFAFSPAGRQSLRGRSEQSAESGSKELGRLEAPAGSAEEEMRTGQGLEAAVRMCHCSECKKPKSSFFIRISWWRIAEQWHDSTVCESKTRPVFPKTPSLNSCLMCLLSLEQTWSWSQGACRKPHQLWILRNDVGIGMKQPWKYFFYHF